MSKEKNSFPKRRKLTVDDYVEGVLSRNRTIIAQTITLVESNSLKHMEMAQEVLKKLLPFTGNSIRIGITGVPGAGKSTLIESFGMMLCEEGHRVAVLAVDPSSSISGGSILGDKTRMESLSKSRNAFVRPSPSGGTLGGVTRKSRETLLVCEAAGFDVILVETVGVGQSEITVRSMVDFFLVIMLTGAGDELQGIKKGIMEIADAIFVNKADGDNKRKALSTKADINQILHYLQPATEGWTPRAYTCSALTGEGIPEIWKVISDYKEFATNSGVFEKRRQNQLLDWTNSMIHDQLKSMFYSDEAVKGLLPEVEKDILDGKLSATLGVHRLIESFMESRFHGGVKEKR
ncbi:methylmalonyl Co-A mutase-associated GTPase MeaB [Evansella sp. AB-rgal1]|uniref:methylmalonyl Co-A mutase-associated GTPase MeaB n=1 Tax=Evansella sp. AB-rgal1 TaxID=3242696 RepID=UPI00359E937A